MKTVYINGTVWTGEGFSDGFAVENGRFAEPVAAPGDEIIDLKKAFVCPGFIDSHMHVVNCGAALSICDLTAHTSSLEDVQGALRDFIREREIAPGAWVRGRGWNQDYFAGAHVIPTRTDLDAVSTEHPITITRCCGHALAVNTKALEVLGLDGSQPQPDGGHYDVDETGYPTGVFRDTAMSMVSTRLPAPDREELKAMIRKAMALLGKCGVTSCHSDDLVCFEHVPWREVLAAYQELQDAGEMTVRVYQQSQLPTVEGLKDFLAAGYNTGVGNDLFRIGPLKVLGDGSLGARTAFLSQDYADLPGERGLSIFTQEEFDALIGTAHAAGMQVAVHVIGDGVVDRVLSAYEKAFAAHPREDHRSGLVHVQITRPDQLKKMREMNLHAYIQSIFIDYDSHIVTQRVGEERANTSYAFHSMKASGMHVSNGTDCPVEWPVAMRGIQCAVTRRPIDGSLPAYRPEEAMSVEEALRSYTAEGAYASFEENVKGMIKPGMLADFVVLSGNPFTVEPMELHTITPLMTVMGGKTVYRKGE